MLVNRFGYVRLSASLKIIRMAYYLGNVEYFLHEKGWTDQQITEALIELQKESVSQHDENNIQTAYIPAGAVKATLGDVLGAEFEMHYQQNRKQFEIAFVKGVVPEGYLARK